MVLEGEIWENAVLRYIIYICICYQIAIIGDGPGTSTFMLSNIISQTADSSQREK